MYFPSKRDLWITMIIWGIALLAIVIPIVNGELFALVFMLPLAALLLWFWFSTGYKIDDDMIRVRYGPIRLKIPVKNIQIIKKKKNPFTAPALSMDKIELVSGRFDVISISPVNQEEFLRLILEINEDITLDSRLKIRE
ncbi:hypothetical protein CIL05_11100 [Virgibacillus profundi]|uniref:Uncharacterized protein YyaB-like PH domain-containing protein n=1 Tax=Virgibacillus profundi TaxID=2024555 RepID=A0A2A2ICP8_9BACI|nr:PH domain-containing protein [Virgibacillus profundi]PAV29407.1 hypothetical protein CIL05_11100 [Virgibacillus profundi]PXY53577.1 hypothetical protein CIT14_11210 [Virgibacillus profundi]